MNEAVPSADTLDTSRTRQDVAVAVVDDSDFDGSRAVRQREAEYRVCRKLALFALQLPVTESVTVDHKVNNVKRSDYIVLGQKCNRNENTLTAIYPHHARIIIVDVITNVINRVFFRISYWGEEYQGCTLPSLPSYHWSSIADHWHVERIGTASQNPRSTTASQCIEHMTYCWCAFSFSTKFHLASTCYNK